MKNKNFSDIIQFIIIILLIICAILILFPEKIFSQPGSTKTEVLKVAREDTSLVITGVSYNYVKIAMDTIVEATYVFHNNICITTMLMGKGYDRRAYADLMRALGYTYYSNSRIWTKDNLIGYLLYNWKLRNWYISIYDSEDFLYTK